MNPVTRLLDSADARMNPVVVKELRQAVTGRLVPALLLLFLAVELFVMVLWLMPKADGTINFQAGRDAFLTMHTILLAACLLFIPIAAAVRFSLERSDANVDLLFITTIRPRTIVVGKFLSAMVVATLLYSACLPFLSLTYLLRGIDLPTIALTMAVGYLVLAESVLLGLMLASIPAPRLIRGLFALGLLVAMVYAIGVVSAGNWHLIYDGTASRIGTGAFWADATPLLVLALCGGAMMFAATVAILSPPASNRGPIFRGTATGVWLVSGGGIFALAYLSHNFDPVGEWVVLTMMALWLTLIVAISEREVWNPRILASVPRGRFRRMLAFPFFSGAPNAVAWTLAMLGLTLAVVWNIPSTGPGLQPSDLAAGFAAFTGYVVAYALLALLLQRCLLRRFVSPSSTYAIAFILLGFVTLVPMVIWLLSTGGTTDMIHFQRLFIVTPVIMFAGNGRTPPQLPCMFGDTVGLVAVVLGCIWIIRRYRAFRPPAPAAVAVDASPSEPVAAAEEGEGAGA